MANLIGILAWLVPSLSCIWAMIAPSAPVMLGFYVGLGFIILSAPLANKYKGMKARGFLGLLILGVGFWIFVVLGFPSQWHFTGR